MSTPLGRGNFALRLLQTTVREHGERRRGYSGFGKREVHNMSPITGAKDLLCRWILTSAVPGQVVGSGERPVKLERALPDYWNE